MNGRNFYYERSGTGPTILTVHGGLGGDHVGCKFQLKHLENKFEFIYFDLRGHGKSDPIDETSFTYDDFVEDIENLRKELNLGQMYLMGMSAGSYISLVYVEKFSENLKGLILYTPLHRFNEHLKPHELTEVAKRRMPRQYHEFMEFDKRIREIEGDIPTELRRKHQHLALFTNFYNYDDRLKDTMWEFVNASQLNFKILQRDLQLRMKLDIKLEKISAPTLILATRYDVTPMHVTKEIVELIPHTEFHISERSGAFSSNSET